MKQKGFVLLADLLLTMLLMSILMAMAVPQVIQIQKTQEMITAKARVRTLAQVQAAIALCNATPGCSPSVGLTAQVPVGTIAQDAYVFTYCTGRMDRGVGVTRQLRRKACSRR